MQHNSPYAAPQSTVVSVRGEQAARVLRNTYMLLGMTLAFSAACGWFAMSSGVGFVNPILTLVVYIGLLIFTNVMRNSAAGIVGVFGITGWLGFTTGPIISAYAAIPGGMELVTLALASTAVVFVALSAVALVSRKDFSFLGQFLMVGIIVAFLGGLAAYFFNLPTLALAVSGAFVLLSSMLILWQTSAIVHGGETNYIMATVTLFVSIYNLFMSLLHIFTALSGDD
ncbi:MAG: Bax inhibitor-1/YccA family protein [Alcanivoracaceae bacterium]